MTVKTLPALFKTLGLTALLLSFAIVPELWAVTPVPGTKPASPWASGFDKARQRAIRSRKDILVVFTIRRLDAGSRHFEEHYLTQPLFAETLTKNFELVWLDSSENGGDQEDSPAYQLRSQFEVISFPTVVLTNWLGQPYCYTGLRPGSLENYLAHIEQLRQKNLARNQTLIKARASEGLRRAELLAASIPELGQQRSAKFYADLMSEILTLDPEQKCESTLQISRQLADFDFNRKMHELEKDLRWTEMADLVNEYIASQKLTGAHRQAALMDLLEVRRHQEDLPRMIQTLEEIVKINPLNRHGQQASAILSQISSGLKSLAPLSNPPEAK